MIFQETSASFDPEFSLERILEEPLVIQKKRLQKRSGKNVWQKCSDWFRWKNRRQKNDSGSFRRAASENCSGKGITFKSGAFNL